MKKSLVVSLLILVVFLGWIFLGSYFDYGLDAGVEAIGLIPLDSRPANTQYPQLLAEIAGFSLEIPYEYLDNFLTPADTTSIWEWLYQEGIKFDTLIINTSVLFNGSLIETRHPQSYVDYGVKLAELREFALNNQDKEIIVIHVLPRLLPSQFIDLWQYRDALVEYGIALDKGALYGESDLVLPENVPLEAVEEYLSIYEGSQGIAEGLIDMVQEGLIGHLLIGQDDAEKYGLANKVVRDLAPKFNEGITFVHGADELTMLALVQAKIPVTEKGLDVVFSNADYLEHVFPFEADTLANVLEAKMDYLGLTINDDAPFLQIIHTEREQSPAVIKYLTESNHQYIGVTDIALTNRGDIGLLDTFLDAEIFQKINGYSGWNTASNALGTELAHFAAVQHFLGRELNKREMQASIEAYVKFKYIRFAEDFIYQGILRSKLNEKLLAQGLNPNNLGERQAEAVAILEELYAPYKDRLKDAFAGEYTLGDVTFEVKDIDSQIALPWARTFEAKVVPRVKVIIK